MADYPSNSYRSKELAQTEAAETRPEKRVEKVVSGKVKVKENKGRKLTDMFISEDAGNIKEYVLMDVLVPGIKRIASDILKDTVDMLFGNGVSRRDRSSGTSKVSYRSYYKDERSRFDDRRDSDGRRGRSFL